jgi:hypothetical protein
MQEGGLREQNITPNHYDFVMPEKTPASASARLARKFTFAVKAGLPQKSQQVAKAFASSLNSTKSQHQGASYTRTRASNMTATNWDDIDVRSLALPPLSDFVDHHKHLFGHHSPEAAVTEKDIASTRPVSLEHSPHLPESVVTAHPRDLECARRHRADPRLSLYVAATMSVFKQRRVNVSTWNVLSSEVIKEGYLSKHTEHSGPCTSLR